MQEASFMGLIRTLVIIIAVYYVLKFFMKYIAPILLVKYVQKQTGQQVQKEPVTKEGTTTIDKKPQERNIVNDNVGEYVDYEEVD
ncbi:DUF4834 family protein [Wenyingzhuangia aestuarii]|uniref:DUF4834 family protein n=1 Tax=Wenyingzhuangia aestuarii TaxID=1647582 RepID=UPI001FD7C6BB|nr:DUF4834 family protein [Wenyingzhuangia aestuarii]NJB82584.1 hypothetical protein [Wenyingzhuangia aestuarii]